MDDKKIILEVQSGSFLYGTNTETSDKDFLGIFIPSLDEELGLFRENEIDLSKIDKTPQNKNTSDSIDRKFYHLRKFVLLAAENNPNILELLFPSEKSIIYISDVGKELLKNNDIFLHKGLVSKFLNYVKSQKHKMVIKTEKFEELNKFLAFFRKCEPKMYLSELKYDKDFLRLDDEQNCLTADSIKIGDLSFPYNIFIKEAIKRIEKRINYGTNRQDLILKYGYDCKFGSHLIRLLYEAIELLSNNKLTFPLTNASVILDIKLGKMNINDVLQLSENLESRILELEKNSNLPEKIDMIKVNDLYLKLLKLQYHMEA